MKISFSLLFSTIIMIASLTAQIGNDFLNRKLQESDVAVIGRVSERESAWRTDRKMIFTSNKIEILGVIKGEVVGVIEIVTYGGEIDDKFQIWSHERTLDLGETGYFFLKEDRTHFAKPQSYYLLNGDDGFIPILQKTTFASPNEESTVTEKVVEFGFDNIQILPANKFSFDLLIRTNDAGVGLEFGFGEVFAKYSSLVFGTQVDSTGRLEVEKETLISSPNYVLSTEDFAADIFKTLISGGCNSTGSLLTTGIPLTTVFQKLLSITIEIQDITAIGTISLDEFQMDGNIYYFDPNTGDCLPFDNIIYPNPIETGLVCNISGFFSDLDPMHPDRTAAGTDNILTITGMNFGNSPGAVEFQNADIPGGALVTTNIVDFMPSSGGEWTDIQIKVKVPSSPVTAGSGVFQVRTSGNMVCPSPTSLEVCYAAFTFRTSTDEVRKVYLADFPDNIDGQLTFSLDAGLNNNINAKNAIETALCDWHEQTEINWNVSGTHNATIPSIDNVNNILLAPAGVFENNPGANMRTILSGTTRILSCNDISNIPPVVKNYTTDIDIAVRADLSLMNPPASGGWNFDVGNNPSPNQLDFYSIIQHELGHAHLLKHALHGDKKMYPNSPIGDSMRDIGNKDGLGGNFILNTSEDNLVPLCPTPVGRSLVCGLVSINELAIDTRIKVYPNPMSSDLNISFTLDRSCFVQANLYNLLGESLLHINFGQLATGTGIVEIPISPNLAQGIYLLVVDIDGFSHTHKLMKL